MGGVLEAENGKRKTENGKGSKERLSPFTVHCSPFTVHCSPFTVRRNRAFTLVELLIVLLLMGIVYGIAFNTVLGKTSKEKGEEGVSLATIDRVFKESPAYKSKRIDLFCSDRMKCYLSVEGNVTTTFDLMQPVVAYRLNPDETLQIVDYPHIRLGREEFSPAYILSCRKNGLFVPAILRSVDTWYYLHPFLGMKTFSDSVSMVSFIRRSDYLPDKAGYAQ